MSTPSSTSKLALGAHEFRTSSGSTLSYYVTGHGKNVLVNVAPGWGPGSVVYQNSFTFLEDVFTFVHLEARGTRRSSMPEDKAAMSSWHMAEDVESLREYLDFAALDLAGHSNGGCIVEWYAVRFPTRARRLVLLGSMLLGPESDAVAEPAMGAILKARMTQDAECVRAFQTWNPPAMSTDEEFGASLHAFLPLYLARPARDFATLTAAFTNVPQLRCMNSQRPAEAQHADQVQAIQGIRARTLVVVGREDFICPVAISKLISERIKDSVLRVIEDAGHFTWIEQQAAFRNILTDFYDDPDAA